MYKEIFATRIKHAREETKFTQREVEKLTKIPHSTISKYEKGTIEPNLENLGILAEIYNVSIDWLLGVSQKNLKEESKKEHKDRESILNEIEKEAKKVM